MTYYEFLWRWVPIKSAYFIKSEYFYICIPGYTCNGCPFYTTTGCIEPSARFTNFNQVLCFAQGLRKAGLLK